jgi:DNA helicase-2/ATP-dependent DNA helicase PcrA
VRHLSSFHRNLFVVGDIDQSIYRWRGADYRNVLRFEQDFPDAQVILLEQNYRSTQSILNVAMAVIDPHPYRTPKHLFTDRGDGEAVMLVETQDDREEARWVVEKISRLSKNQQVKPGDIAIMYRTNAQSRLLEEEFLQRGMRYRLVGAQRFYGRREVKDLIAYLRVVHNPSDELSLLRVLNTPPRGIGNKTVIGLQAFARQNNLSLGEAVLAVGRQPQSAVSDLLPLRAAASAARFADLLASWRSQSNNLPPLELLDLILHDIDYRAYIDDGSEEGQDRWDNVMELRRLASEFKQPGLEGFLERVALVSDQDTLAEGNNAPTLLTLHAAKGLEFPVVFIVGLNQGTLPHSRSLEDKEAVHEERRLLYVGITRAKDRLYLLYSQQRSAFGYAEPVYPSQFLDDIPAHLLQVESNSSARPSVAFSSSRDARQSALPAARSVPIVQNRFAPGTRVRHPAWGEGIVLNSLIQDDDEIVDIFFESVGLKRVAASLAKLEIP